MRRASYGVPSSSSKNKPDQHGGGGLVSLTSASLEDFPSTLNLYQSAPPSQDITIHQFERLATSRLQILRSIEAGIAKGQREDELVQVVRRSQEKYNLPLHSNESAAAFNVEEERMNDFVSHWLLRLAFASSPDSIKWFLSNEGHLFRLRFSMCNLKEKTEFINNVHLPYEQVSEEERNQLSQELQSSTLHCKQVQGEMFLKVPWTVVLDLVSKRQVLLNLGYAYVPSSDLFSVVFSMFKDNLELEMERLCRLLLSNPLEERIVSLLNTIKNSDYESTTAKTSNTNELSAGDVEAASIHFPPCMSNMYGHLKSDKHLKYNGRQQFGLFLKSIGLPFNEALLFWKRSFSRISDDEFNKNYAYNVRHNYGLEGKRANYGCMSCKQIIPVPQHNGDHSGCPFRNQTIESLSNMLANVCSLNEFQVKEVTELARSGHHQLACTKVLECRSSTPNSRLSNGDTIINPTQFYEASLANAAQK